MNADGTLPPGGSASALLLDRQIARLFPLENASDIGTGHPG
jgi:hypothetical protein